MKETREVTALRQLLNGPVWDGNLVDKTARKTLVEHGLAFRVEGWTSITSKGIKTAEMLGYLKP